MKRNIINLEPQSSENAFGKHYSAQVWRWQASVGRRGSVYGLRPATAYGTHSRNSKHTQLHTCTHTYRYYTCLAGLLSIKHTGSGEKKELSTLHVKTTNVLYRSTHILYTVNTFHLSPSIFLYMYTHIHPINSMRMWAHHTLSSHKCGDHYHMMWMWAVINKTGSELEMFMRRAIKNKPEEACFLPPSSNRDQI